MDHDEFAKRPTRTRSNEDVDVPAFPLELGGGLSLSLAASLNPSISSLLLGLGGLLPLVTTSLGIARHRAAEFLHTLAPGNRGHRTNQLASAHFATIRSASTIGRYRDQTPNQSIRSRSDES